MKSFVTIISKSVEKPQKSVFKKIIRRLVHSQHGTDAKDVATAFFIIAYADTMDTKID